MEDSPCAALFVTPNKRMKVDQEQSDSPYFLAALEMVETQLKKEEDEGSRGGDAEARFDSLPGGDEELLQKLDEIERGKKSSRRSLMEQEAFCVQEDGHGFCGSWGDDDAVLSKLAEMEREKENAAVVPPRLDVSWPPAGEEMIFEKLAAAEKLAARKLLSSWGLPRAIVSAYEAKGVRSLYDWQCECLSAPGVAEGNKHLVYSAPTSGGKTLVAELLMIKRVVETGRKAMFIVPTAALAEEKTTSFSRMLADAGLLCEGYYRSFGNRFLEDNGLPSSDIAVCTIEKAHHLFNKLYQKGKLGELCCIVVDEAHMIGNPDRGMPLEGLISKVLYLGMKRVQLVLMSATLPNLNVFNAWIGAEVYCTSFRPVPLREHVVDAAGMVRIVERRDTVGNIAPAVVRKVAPFPLQQVGGKRVSPLLSMAYTLCSEAIAAQKSVLVFGRSRAECEQVAVELIDYVMQDEKTRTILIADEHKETRELAVAKLCRSAGGLNEKLKIAIEHGIAFHHAGLTEDERCEVEKAYKKGCVRVLIATSTLAIGVNLPAGRVIFYDFRMGSNILTTTEYLQMCGRAGRAGIDAVGESFVLGVSGVNEATIVKKIAGPPAQLSSAVLMQGKTDGNMTSFLLDAVGRGFVQQREDVNRLVQCSLACFCCGGVDGGAQQPRVPSQPGSPGLSQQLQAGVVKSLSSLQNQDYFTEGSDGSFRLKPLAIAVSCTWMTPPQAKLMLSIVHTAMARGVVLQGTLHFCYLLAPIDPELENGDTTRLLTPRELFRKCRTENHVLERVFGSEVEVERIGTVLKADDKQRFHRLYVAKIVSEMLHEHDLDRVSREYGVGMSFVQGLMERSCVMAAQLVPFLELLGTEYKPLAAALDAFVPRLEAGVQAELIQLMQIPKLSRIRARALFAAGFETLEQVSQASEEDLFKVLVNAEKWKEAKRALNPQLSDVIERKAAKSIIRNAGEVLFRRKLMETHNSAIRPMLLEELRTEKKEREQKKFRREQRHVDVSKKNKLF